MKHHFNRVSVAVIIATVFTFVFVGEAMSTEWNVSLWGKRRAFTEHIEKIAELVSQKTNGKFVLKLSYGGLSKNKENLDGISIGAFEMAQFCAGYHRDKNPTITVLELPFLGVANLQEEVAIANAVYAHPAVQADLARWNAKLLMTTPLPQYNLVGTGEPLNTLASMKGMRVRATGGVGKAFKALGAVPTSVTATEAYNALESGVVDTVAFAQHAHLAFRTIDIADWWTENLNPGTSNCPVVVNIDAYNALSDSEREALDNSVDEAIAHYLANYAALLDKWDGILKAKNIKRVHISDEDLATFRKAAADPIREQWIKDMSAQGIPAQELYDLLLDTLKKERMKS
jgi:TRAP-type C4-dicarboxylate transport system substrate-binding protein